MAKAKKKKRHEPDVVPDFAPPPFSFVITIERNASIDIKSVNLEGFIATKDDFEIKDGNIICTLAASISTFTFLLIIEAEGPPDAITTFNMTCDAKQVFAQGQEIMITSTGRGGYVNREIPLP